MEYEQTTNNFDRELLTAIEDDELPKIEKLLDDEDFINNKYKFAILAHVITKNKFDILDLIFLSIDKYNKLFPTHIAEVSLIISIDGNNLKILDKILKKIQTINDANSIIDRAIIRTKRIYTKGALKLLRYYKNKNKNNS